MQKPLGNALIPYGTPLHVTELVLQLLKLVFQDFPEDHPYRYDPDDYENTGVAFDVVFNKKSKIYGKRPIIVVNRGPQTTDPAMIGDFAGADLMNYIKRGSGLLSSSVNILVGSRSKPDVEIISQHIFSYLMTCRTHLPRLTGVHMAMNISLSDVSRADDDDEFFQSSITLSYVMQYLWTQTEVLDKLNSIIMSFNDKLNEKDTRSALRTKATEPAPEPEPEPSSNET